MLSKDELLKVIKDGYAARARGDKEAVDQIWAEGATYRLAGDASLLKSFPSGSAVTSTREIIDLITFHDHECVEAVIDGLKAAVLWKITCSARGGKPFETELYDLWTFDDAGKATSVTQFTDTALLASALNAAR